jgi:hypothetical protein
MIALGYLEADPEDGRSRHLHLVDGQRPWRISLLVTWEAANGDTVAAPWLHFDRITAEDIADALKEAVGKMEKEWWRD